MADALPKIANPAPLGLAGFGLTTVVLSSINAGLVSGDAGGLIAVVVPLAFAYGGLAQLIAGILEYINGNTFGMVAFTSYGCFWWWFALLFWTSGAKWISAPAGHGVGVALLLWGIFTFFMWIPTFKTNTTLWLVFLTLWIAFFLLAAGDLGWMASGHSLGGWDGLLCGILALYLSFAEVTNAAWGTPAIPIGGPIMK